MSVEDVSALKRLEDETRYVNGQYEVPMLWSNPSVRFPDNFMLAKKRFEYLKRRLRNDPKLYNQYKETIDMYVE